MTVFRPKLWTAASAAILLTAVAAARTGRRTDRRACRAVGEGGEGGPKAGGRRRGRGLQRYQAVPAESRVALRWPT